MKTFKRLGYTIGVGFFWLIVISLVVHVIDMKRSPKAIPDHNTPVYLCHTYATWDARNYAEFTVQRDGKTIACLLAGPKQP